MIGRRTVALAGALVVLSTGCGAGGDELAFGGMLLRTVLALVAVSAAAVLSLRWLAGRGVGMGRSDARHMEVLERLPLGPRRSLLAVRVADRVLVLAEDADATRPVAEMPASAWPSAFAALVDDEGVATAAAKVTAARNIGPEPSDPDEQDIDSPSHEIVA